MSSAQKIIKYLALALASFLIFIIITSIISGMTILSNIFDDNDNNNQTVEKNEILISDSKDLNIDLATSDLIIKEGNKFKVETTNKYIRKKEENNKLYITEKNHNVFKNENNKVVIYLNENQELNNVKMGENVLNDFAKELEDVAVVEKKPKLEGKNMFIILAKKAN